MLTVLPVGVLAAREDEHDRICNQITSTYRKTLAASGKESLQGYCGMMAGWELYFLGITETAVTQNGNEMYDILSSSDQISEGYTPVCYPVEDYSLEAALNAVSYHGTKDVYNIILGFQWTNTEAGSLYGHVTVVHAILDGKVYFTEGFMTPFQSDPSRPMICTIEEFANHYDTWTKFEGLIHFDTGMTVAGCDSIACDLFVMAEDEITLLSKPDFLDGEQCRIVPAGERLYASAMCRNMEGVLFYQIKEKDQVYYIPAGQAKPVWFNDSQIQIQDSVFPERIGQGEHGTIAGTIKSKSISIANVAVGVVDQNGDCVLSREVPVKGTSVDLKVLDKAVDFSQLPEGSYTLSIYCDLENPYCINGEIIRNMHRVAVSQTVFGVGMDAVASRAVPASSMTLQNGWQYQSGKWYYCENGSYRSGWFCDNGIDYYLLEDGSAATGWQEINGKNRYFSETGAMRTGWLETAEGTFYMLRNGAAATGLTDIRGSRYFFDASGRMLTDTTVKWNDTTYCVDETGIVENQ